MTQLDIEARIRLQERRAVLLRDQGSGDSAELAEIDAALQRIEEQRFGLCEICGRALGRQRLRAFPTARYCLSCSGSIARSKAPQR